MVMLRPQIYILCCSCGMGITLNEDPPTEKTCEQVVSGLCVNANGHNVNMSVVQSVLDAAYSTYAESYGEFNVQILLSDNGVSLDFVSAEEISFFCSTSNQGCFLSSPTESSIYVKITAAENRAEWLRSCVWPGNVLGHELLHVFNRYRGGASWIEDIGHLPAELFQGDNSVLMDCYEEIHHWCFTNLKREENA